MKGELKQSLKVISINRASAFGLQKRDTLSRFVGSQVTLGRRKDLSYNSSRGLMNEFRAAVDDFPWCLGMQIRFQKGARGFPRF